MAASIPAQREGLKPSSAALLWHPVRPRFPGEIADLGDAAAPQGVAAGLVLIRHGAKTGTSPPRSVALPSHEATVRKADYPRPDVTFCSRCGSGTEWV